MASATFEVIDEMTRYKPWLKTAVKTTSQPKAVRVHCQDGTRLEVPVGVDRRFTVTDPRAIRHCKADTRYTLVSES